MIRRAFALICFCDMIFLTNPNLNQIATKKHVRIESGSNIEVHDSMFDAVFLPCLACLVSTFSISIRSVRRQITWVGGRCIVHALLALQRLQVGTGNSLRKCWICMAAYQRQWKIIQKQKVPWFLGSKNCQKLAKHNFFVFFRVLMSSWSEFL